MTKLTVASATLLCFLAVLVRAGLTADLDLAGIRSLQTLANDVLDGLANAHTVVGQLAITLPAAVVLSIVAWRRGGGLAWIAPLFILVTGAIELALKLTTGHPPPGEEFDRAFMNPLGVRVTTPSAFPSGHVARLTFLAVVAGALVQSARVRGALAAFIAFSMLARVYIGDHWPSDVLGGLLLGIAVGGAAVLGLQSAASKSSFARRK